MREQVAMFPELDICEACDGSGLVWRRVKSKLIGGRHAEFQEFCPDCNGTGKAAGKPTKKAQKGGR